MAAERYMAVPCSSGQALFGPFVASHRAPLPVGDRSHIVPRLYRKWRLCYRTAEAVMVVEVGISVWDISHPLLFRDLPQPFSATT